MKSFDMRDAIGFAGLCLISAGVAMMHVPSALIVGGALLVAGAVLAARPK